MKIYKMVPKRKSNESGLIYNTILLVDNKVRWILDPNTKRWIPGYNYKHHEKPFSDSRYKYIKLSETEYFAELL